MHGPEILVPLGFFAMVVVLAIGVPLTRAFGRRWDRPAERFPLRADAAARLERMEQALEAVAVEVERISEGQRFVTKLLSTKAADRVSLPSAGPPDV
ncbi:MAG: hypothetical protein NVS4B3_20950 [Gemmatimonadaceae bacterium]